MSEDHETRLRRLHMRCWRRGMKEMDLIFGNFAKGPMHDLNAADLDAFEALMDESDQDLYRWISTRAAGLAAGADDAPPEHGAMLTRLAAFARAEGAVSR